MERELRLRSGIQPDKNAIEPSRARMHLDVVLLNSCLHLLCGVAYCTDNVQLFKLHCSCVLTAKSLGPTIVYCTWNFMPSCSILQCHRIDIELRNTAIFGIISIKLQNRHLSAICLDYTSSSLCW